MLPAQLSAESFQAYPPKGRALALANLALLQSLPFAFTPFLLREIIVYDWQFPYEQGELTSQLAYLSKLRQQQRDRELETFGALKLDPKLQDSDWLNEPAQFLERFSAHLWATQQMDGFRQASEAYIHRFYESLPSEQLAAHRLGIALFGQDVTSTQYPLFLKLRRRGVYFTSVNPAKGLETIRETLAARAAAHAAPYAHWYIEGSPAGPPLPGLTCVSYDGLAAVRTKLGALMLTAYQGPQFDPEQLRTTLAKATPQSVGMPASAEGTLDRFELSLLTEGSGTQIYSTTFVQWAAREALRRARPLTLFTRYTPRQKERAMNELLSGASPKAAADPSGSLIDGDMGAYYTWINMQRLPGAENLRFLAWFEGHSAAVAIAPGLKPGTEDSSPIDMPALLAKLA